MFGIDESVSQLAAGHGAAIVVVIAFLLGLRHASDPDHLVAVSILVAGTRERATRAAAKLGAAWSLGHATTLLLFGLPVVLLHAYLPAAVESLAEALIGVIIVGLAVRLLVRWHRGVFHTHVHGHEATHHAHVHSHAVAPEHRHAHSVRSPAQAFSIGLVHGTAGSGAVAVLVVAAVPDRTVAAVALLALVAGTALSMTILSALVGKVLAAAAARRALGSAIPALGSFACLLGVLYVFEAIRDF